LNLTQILGKRERFKIGSGLYNLLSMIKFILKLCYLDIGEVLDFIDIFLKPQKSEFQK